MRVHEVGVGGAVLEGLVGVAHAAGHVHRAGRIELTGEDLAERVPRTQVDPHAKDRSRRDRDELVPRLSMDAPRDTLLGIEGDVVLHGAKLGGQTGSHHLCALPVLLEPPARVAVHGQV